MTVTAVALAELTVVMTVTVVALAESTVSLTVPVVVPATVLTVSTPTAPALCAAPRAPSC